MTNNISYATDTALFAMGCFWCAESEFSQLDGVLSVTSGYAGGTTSNPTYENHVGYKEAIKIEFDASKIAYEKLLEVFWRNIDPFDNGGQFVDRGKSYTSAIYYKDNKQKTAAEQSKAKIIELLLQKNKPNVKIVTEITPLTTFYPAEEYHQDYKHKNPARYLSYRAHSGRDSRLSEIWD